MRASIAVPGSAATVTVAVSSIPAPGSIWQATEEADAHATVAQRVATATEGVASTAPKLTPARETEPLPEEAALLGARKETVGAEGYAFAAKAVDNRGRHRIADRRM